MTFGRAAFFSFRRRGQAVFKGDCASCHVEPAKGKTGLALYTAACAICHDGEHRASMVPDLNEATIERGGDPAYWDFWIRHGKEGSLMPAFAQAAGGPLEEAQIRSLVEGLTARRRNGLWPEQGPSLAPSGESVAPAPDAPLSCHIGAALTRGRPLPKPVTRLHRPRPGDHGVGIPPRR